LLEFVISSDQTIKFTYSK